jgi:heme-degrading monooxygenase HmoA
MFARLVTMQLKPSLAREFPVAFEKEIAPLLKKQKGFVDELLLVAPRTKEMVAISLWETKEDAETYNRELYPSVEKMVEKFIEGEPITKNFDEKYATFHEMAVQVTV